MRTTARLWINDETSLHILHSSLHSRHIPGVEAFSVHWLGNATTASGCPATATIQVRLQSGGQLLANLQNGEDIALVRPECGPIARYDPELVILKLSNVVVTSRDTDDLITPCRDLSDILTLSVSLDGTVRLYPPKTYTEVPA